MGNSHVLFVDDDERATQALIRSLGRQDINFTCSLVVNAEQAKKFVREKKPEVAVIDLSLDPTLGPDSGLTLISDLLQIDPTLRILVLTGHASDEVALKALQVGAASFLKKPIDVIYLFALLNDAVSFAQLKRRYQELSTSTEQLQAVTGLSSANPQMQKVIEQVAFAATNNQPVFILGETGTGKGVIAQAIHQAGERRNGPFIRFQPSFGGGDLVSSELFGHTKGAFTGALESRTGVIEAAHNGTLFLDEVDELPTQTQISMLDVLQERRFRKLGSNKEQHSNFRLIAATNRRLETIREEKKLREDFYHRIAHCRIEIPALRERLEDISLLAQGFIQEIANRENIAVYGISAAAENKLKTYPWPGNVRELLAKIEGALYRAQFHQRRIIEPEDLELRTEIAFEETSGLSFRDRVRSYEVQLVKDALKKANNNQSKAAESLHLDRSTLRRILERSEVQGHA